ncbi:transglutaminase-like domain-containing protein [Nonomuraea sp. NPDC049028]|uniref:transglutaminase-like domain-containing protein n=1 Tax=Nonomuraea sp. NPDC049028 TaxID=3364348 RepID=UPI0037163ED7
MPDVAAFYVAQSGFSTPGGLATLYADLPMDLARLASIVRGLMIHRWEGDRFRYDIPRDRLHNDAETRYADDILAIIVGRNDEPLARRREPDDRFVGVCRDFALLYCSFLRHVGIPARLRSGFAAYLGPAGFHVDHMVTEYWDDERGWCLSDPQLADVMIAEPLRVDFDPLDIPRDRFLVAGRAWRMLRTGEADPRAFGLHFPGRIMSGEGFVAGNLLLDIAALNKMETLLWDVWGAIADIDHGITEADRELYDHIAALTADDVPFGEVRKAFVENERLRTPAMVLSLAPFNGPRDVTLREEVFADV